MFLINLRRHNMKQASTVYLKPFPVTGFSFIKKSGMSSIKRIVVGSISFLLVFASSLSLKAQDGKGLFQANCAQCHAVNSVVIGPALKDIDKRRPEAWLLKWVKNSQAVVKSGD